MKKQQNTHKIFSVAYKKEKVDLLDNGKITVTELINYNHSISLVVDQIKNQNL